MVQVGKIIKNIAATLRLKKVSKCVFSVHKQRNDPKTIIARLDLGAFELFSEYV